MSKDPSPPDSPSSFTDADWESAAEEARAAGHRVDRTAEGYDVYPRGEVVRGGPSMRFRRGGDDPAGSLNDLRRMKDMRKNPAPDSIPPSFITRVKTAAQAAPESRSKKSILEWVKEAEDGYDVTESLYDISDSLSRIGRKDLYQEAMNMGGWRENPAQTSRFKEGDRVTFSPNAAAMQLYTAGTYPPVGTSGSVTTVSVPGGRKVNMPGPRGGMVYVKWDGWGTIGVFGVDLVRDYASARSGDGGRRSDLCPSRDFGKCQFRSDGMCGFCGARKNPGPASGDDICPSWGQGARVAHLFTDGVCDYCQARRKGSEGLTSDHSSHDLNAHEVVITDRELINDLFDWHGGQGDPVYAIASSSQAGRPVSRELVDRAVSSLNQLAREIDGKENKRHLGGVINALIPYGT